MSFKLDENLRKAFLKHRRGEYDQKLDGMSVFYKIFAFISPISYRVIICQAYNLQTCDVLTANDMLSFKNYRSTSKRREKNT